MINSEKHTCHKPEIKKLNRVAGQVEGIKRMIGDGRHCPDILTQLRAARSALKTIEANILESHLQSCVKDAIISGNKDSAAQKIEELKTLFKRFEE